MNDAEQVDRLITKIDGLFEAVTYIKTEQGVISSKLDSFSDRISKLEERDDKHLERAENLERLLTKLETVVDTYMKNTNELESKVDQLDKDVTIIKNNWAWACTLMGLIGAGIGHIVGILVHYIKGGY